MSSNKYIEDLCKALLLIKTKDEAYNFLKDLCTPTELESLAERWQICKLLHQGFSYREIQTKIGSSLSTIGRVARFLKDEPYQGYTILLSKINNEKLK